MIGLDESAMSLIFNVYFVDWKLVLLSSSPSALTEMIDILLHIDPCFGPVPLHNNRYRWAFCYDYDVDDLDIYYDELREELISKLEFDLEYVGFIN